MAAGDGAKWRLLDEIMTRSSLSFRTLSEERSGDPKPLSNRARDGRHELCDCITAACPTASSKSYSTLLGRTGWIQRHSYRFESMLVNTGMPYSRLVRYGGSKSVMDGGVMDGKRSGKGLQYGTVLRRNHSGAPDHPTHKMQ